MDSSWFRILAVLTVLGMGWWWWRDHEAREEAAEVEEVERAQEVRSQAGETVRAVEQKTNDAAASHEKRIQDATAE